MRPQPSCHPVRRAASVAGAAGLLAFALFGLECIWPGASGARNAAQAAYAALATVGGIGAGFGTLAALDRWLGRKRRPRTMGGMRLGTSLESLVYLTAGLGALSIKAAQGACVLSAEADWLRRALSNLQPLAVMPLILLEVGLMFDLAASERSGSAAGPLRLFLLLPIAAAGAATEAIHVYGPTPKATATAVGGILFGLLGIIALSEWFARCAEARATTRPETDGPTSKPESGDVA